MIKLIKNLLGVLRVLKYKIIYGARLELDFTTCKKPIYIGRYTKIIIGKNSKLILSGGNYFSEFCYISVQDGGICKIESNVFFNTFSKLYCINNIIIEKDCVLGSNVSIYDHNHKIISETNFNNGEMEKGSINIENNIWIGSNAVILMNVNIKSGCVIGANSVLTKSTLEKGVYCGSPAILKKKIQ